MLARHSWYLESQDQFYQHQQHGTRVRRVLAPPGLPSLAGQTFIVKSYPEEFALKQYWELQGEIIIHKFIQDPCMAALRDVRVTDGWLHLVFDDAGQPLLYNNFPVSIVPTEKEVCIKVTLATATAQTLVRLLNRVHQLGLRFADMKPSQLVGKMAADGTPMVSLVDWGSLAHTSNISNGYIPVFTRRYAPPEALQPYIGGAPDCKIPPEIFLTDSFDVWAMGLTVCEIALGICPYLVPFSGPISEASLQQYRNPWGEETFGYEPAVAHEIFTNPFSFTMAPMWPHLPAHLQQLIVACLQPDPTKRIHLDDIPNMPWAAPFGFWALPLPAPELPIGSGQAAAPAAEQQPRRQEEVGVQVQLGGEVAEECAALKGQLAAEAERAHRAEKALAAETARADESEAARPALETALARENARVNSAEAARAALEEQATAEAVRANSAEAERAAFEAQLAGERARANSAEAERAAVEAQLANMQHRLDQQRAATAAQVDEMAAALQRAQALVQELQHKLHDQRATIQAAVEMMRSDPESPMGSSEEEEEEEDLAATTGFAPLAPSIDNSDGLLSGSSTPISSSTGTADAWVEVLIELSSRRSSLEVGVVCGKQQQGVRAESEAAAGGEEGAIIIRASSSDSVSGSSEDGASSSGAEEVAQPVVHSLYRGSSVIDFDFSPEQQQQQEQSSKEDELQPKAAVQKDERTLKQRFAGAVHKAAKMLGFVKGPKRQ